MNWINLSLSHIVDTVIVCPALCGAHPSYCILLVFDQILRHPGLMMIAESLLQKLASSILKKSHILDPSSTWSNFKASRTYDNSRVSTAETCFLNSKKVSHSMLYVFVEFQTLQIVQLWYQTLKPLFAFVPYFCLEIAQATKKRGEYVKLDAN